MKPIDRLLKLIATVLARKLAQDKPAEKPQPTR